MTTNTSDKCIEICNSLLRGERSAVETYRKAIEKHGDKPEIQQLRRILGEHQLAVTRLEKNVRNMDGTPDADSGTWGTLANAVQSAANLLGANSAVESLIQGEQHGVRSYQDALADKDMMADCKDMVRDDLLPNTEKHILALEEIQLSV